MKDLKFLTFPFEVKEATEENKLGIIEGYASTFGNLDFGLDIVDKGAFTKTLKDKGQVFPILADHDPYKPIGYNVTAEEDAYGLKIRGEVNLETQLGRERMSLAKQALRLGTKMGLSIGYMTVKSEPDSSNPLIRRLKELMLWEYSFVTFPMNDMALVDAVKSQKLSGIDKINSIINHLKDSGISLKDLEIALQLEAAKEKDPTIISQSFKSALDNFTI